MDPAAPAPEIDPLLREMSETPHRFDFFQAVRRLEAMNAEMPRLGEAAKIEDDPVRFRQKPSMAFPPRTLEEFIPAGAGAPARLWINFFGMFGPNGPLPHHLTEFALQRILHNNDPTFARFMDIFHHRLVALFYRTWAVHNQAVSHDRPDKDRFAVYVASICGYGMPSLRGRDSVQDAAKLRYSGHLSCRTRHAEGLKSILEDYFKVPVNIRPFVGHWVDVPEQYWCKLGTQRDACQLGQTALVGRRIFDRQQKFRVQLGPMGLDEYKRFLPGGISFERVVDWVRNYVGDDLEWDLELLLTSIEVPRTQLGKAGQIGWTTWSLAKSYQNQAGSLILRPDGSRAGRRKAAAAAS